MPPPDIRSSVLSILAGMGFGPACVAIVLSAASPSWASDMFSPPSPEDTRRQTQEARIGGLEKQLTEALERLNKMSTEKAPLAKDGTSSVTMPSPLPLPNVKFIGVPQGAAVPIDEERVLGVMNGHEIYVRDGVVKTRLPGAKNLASQ